MSESPVRADPARCPLCGQPNRCAMEIERETGVAQGPCWCLSATFGPELLARVPAEARGQACICAACAARAVPSPAGSGLEPNCGAPATQP